MKTQGIAPVYRVSVVEDAVKYYTEVLGFSVRHREKQYAVMALGEIQLHVGDHSIYPRPVGGNAAYVYCDEVDAYFSEVRDRGAIVKSEPKNWPYGMRDFTVADADGNLLHFGCDFHPDSEKV